MTFTAVRAPMPSDLESRYAALAQRQPLIGGLYRLLHEATDDQRNFWLRVARLGQRPRQDALRELVELLEHQSSPELNRTVKRYAAALLNYNSEILSDDLRQRLNALGRRRASKSKTVAKSKKRGAPTAVAARKKSPKRHGVVKAKS